MACASRSMLTASSSAFTFQCQSVRSKTRWHKRKCSVLFINASSSSDESDCNTEECAPEKEVGKLSMEWLAGDRTKVVGTFPPRRRGWTGYVEKDTAGQTNIYSVEPSVYVAESAISSGNAGTSTEGAETTVAVASALALISIAAASSILIQVTKNEPRVQTVEYSGPPLSYYINKFKPIATEEGFTPASEVSLPPKASLLPESIEADAEASLPSDSGSMSQVQSENNEVVVAEVQVEL
ncbi:hypothetical protein HPP92_015504 [Vanilla planifolia]|uniref:Protein MAINTENANCE OF PSII UNDER HIGH LIGHT 1 n=1 Tax=Vanilla planifolia TaxID=51239 RepID=A0A835QLT4_VANPL|nr:hypothetical protein HPP92_015504 [Vanilla planifolia]